MGSRGRRGKCRVRCHPAQGFLEGVSWSRSFCRPVWWAGLDLSSDWAGIQGG